MWKTAAQADAEYPIFQQGVYDNNIRMKLMQPLLQFQNVRNKWTY